MKLSLKTFTYIISALCVSGFLALIIIGVVFANAFELQQEKMGDLRKINNKLVEENNYLQEKISQIEGSNLVQDAGKAAIEQKTSDDAGKSTNITPNYESSQTVYVDQKIADSAPAKTAYLTFNGGPSASTGKILDILKQHHVKATFFVIGTTIASEKELYRRIVKEGHTIGNLTYSHDFFRVYASEESFIQEFNKLQDLIYEETGVTPRVYRLPGGTEGAKRMFKEQFFKSLNTKMNSKGYLAVDWNVDSRDAGKYRVTKEEVVKGVLSQAEGESEAVILFHDSSEKTASVGALPEIIVELTNMGFTFKAVAADSGTANL